jgi:hypothetical protein
LCSAIGKREQPATTTGALLPPFHWGSLAVTLALPRVARFSPIQQRDPMAGWLLVLLSGAGASCALSFSERKLIPLMRDGGDGLA